ncbi:MAG: sugar phosphate isomerase/epimerase [Verrucomicrobia bacterium]|nr:sugar phosphate isomerase/epimerase [Verrucomicrobiota bacterium]
MNSNTLSRRSFVHTTAVAASALAAGLTTQAAPRKRGIKLGFDNFAVRDMKWNARQLVDYAEKLRCDTVFITDLGPFEGKFEDATLREHRKYATDKGVEIQLGSWSICPTSKAFKKDWGTAEEHLALGIRMAKALGTHAFRVVLGRQDDRKSEGGIEARIANTVKVLKSQRSRAVDASVKVSVENHAGDMQSVELKELIEAAGKDYVGANIDSGNAVWTAEDPIANLEVLAPYVITTSLRDTMLWESAKGVTAQWTAMGDGCVDLKAYFDIFEKRCPGVAVNIETISGFAREMPTNDPEFWKMFPKQSEASRKRFLALAKKGKAIAPFKAPEGADKAKAQQEYQREQVERSIRHCKESLGLGIRM